MCPACLATAGWIITGAASAVGLTALTRKKFRARTDSEIVDATRESTTQTKGEPDGTENRVPQ